MSVHYCFIARDHDMVVFESVLSKEMQFNYKREAIEKVFEMDAYPQIEKPERDEIIGLPGDFNLYVLNSTVFFGCITDGAFNSEKAFRFLADLKTEFAKIYKGNL